MKCEIDYLDHDLSDDLCKLVRKELHDARAAG